MQCDVRQRTPTPASAVPEQRGRAAGGCAVRRTGEAGSHATMPGDGTVSGCSRVGGHGVPVEDVAVVGVLDHLRPRRAKQARDLPARVRRRDRRRRALLGRCGSAAGRTETMQSAAAVRRRPVHFERHQQRLRLVTGRVARVFARVRQEGTADAARVMLPEGGRQKSASETLRLDCAAATKAQVQPAQVRGTRVVRGRATETASGRGRRVHAQRVRPQRVRLLSRHAVRPTGRVPDPVQGRRKLFGNLRPEVNTAAQRYHFDRTVVCTL